MARLSIAFALGALFCHQLASLPDPLLVGLSPLLLVLARGKDSSALTAVFVLGVAWTALHAEVRLAQRLPPGLEGEDLTISAEVVSAPLKTSRATRFQARVLDAPHNSGWRASGCLIRLGSYSADTLFQMGERWQLTVRLRVPRSTRNPGDWDREHQALRQGLCALGHIRHSPPPRRLAAARSASWQLLRVRLGERLKTVLQDLPAGALVLALTLGDRSAISPEQRDLLRATATAHLVAISGLHIGMVAASMTLMGTTLMRVSAWACRRWTARDAGLALGLASAVVYAALAGFTLPTQRALVMVASVCLASVLRRRGAVFAGLSLALLGVLILDPLSVIGADLWLSFTAAFALLAGLEADPRPPPATRAARAAARIRGGLVTLARVQLTAGLALMPLSLLVFGHQAWLGPVYNAIAVPLTGMLTVPCALGGLLLQSLDLPGGVMLLRFAAHVLGLTLELLRWLHGLEPEWRAGGAISIAAAACALLGVALALRGQRASLLPLAVVLCLPALFPEVRRPGAGELWLDVLDVGQGLAAIVQTNAHTLVYDTGPPWSGGPVLINALRRRAVSTLDVLLVSHGDIDHAGGVPALLRTVAVSRLIGNAKGLPDSTVACHQAAPWHWDGYRFELIHPPRPRRGNDGSCVLRVRGPGGAVLLPGDIEARAELALTRRLAGALSADVMVAPHHGSRSSSTAQLLAQVMPAQVLVPSGHGNRFGFPHDDVLRRYQQRGIAVHDTGCSGRLRVVLSPGHAPRVEHWWPAPRRFWHVPVTAGHCTAIGAS